MELDKNFLLDLSGLPKKVDYVQPVLPAIETVYEAVRDILLTGKLTNHSKYVQEFEKQAASYLDVKHAVAVANGTLGLILALQALDLHGQVIVPSFTFSATAHAIAWNNLEPVFVDIDPDTYTLDPVLAEQAITQATSAILPVHVFGNLCDIDAFQQIAQRRQIRLVFDSAHAFGAKYRGIRVGGFGDLEVFSLHATKILPAGEGGLVTTNDDAIAERIRQGRNFGNTGDYDCAFVGLNAKMMEFAAILALWGLQRVDESIGKRRELVRIYENRLSQLPGLTFQRFNPDSEVNYQNFSIRINPKLFGMDRDELAEILAMQNILTRKYFYPPIHRYTCYRKFSEEYDMHLKNTNWIAEHILCLPLSSKMSFDTVEKICIAIENAYHYNAKVQDMHSSNGIS